MRAHRRLATNTCVLVATLAWVAPAGAQEPPPPPPVQRSPTDPAELAAFVDGVLATQLKDKHIAGATFVMVVDGKPFFAKGYGYADVAAKKPVDPEKTMFRIGSVSKLFTWTAVMQLAEQGKLDLDADINTYLTDFKIPQTYPEPITLKHLLAHTPGFEDHVIGLFGREPSDEPLGKLLARNLPARVRPPGVLGSYSNHGTALAGYIVAQVSGMPWEDYIEQHLLTPLEMHNTTVRQPAADKLSADMSKGYKYASGKYWEQGFEYVPPAPAGSMAASAGDIAKFMIAHLQDGQYHDARILKPETAQQMRETLWTHDASQPGMAYGFMRMSYNGEEIVEHGGDTRWFHSHYVTLPKHKAGYFISYNTESGGGARNKVFEILLDRYWPPLDVPAVKPAAEPHDALARYAGKYGAIRHSYTSIAKVGALFGVADVSIDGDTLVVQSGENAKRFVEVAPLVFHEVDGQGSLAFREADDGHITHLFVGSGPSTALERLPTIETPRFNLALVVACVALFLSALIGWPVVAFVTREARLVDPRSSRGARVASLIGWFTCLVVLAILAVSMIPLSDPDQIVFGVPPMLNILLVCTLLVPALVLAMLVCSLVAWAKGYWRFSGRLHYTSVLVAGLAFVWFLNHWNLLKFGA